MNRANLPEGVLVVFLDGVGIGAGGAQNPLDQELPGFECVSGGSRWTDSLTAVAKPRQLFHLVDANLGLPGLPQSGTGQATIFTGANCAELAGRHFGPFPHSSSRGLIEERNLMLQVARMSGSRRVAFANAFPERYLSYLEKTGRWSVTTASCRAAGVRLRTSEDLMAGQAVAADLTGAAWPESATQTVTTVEESAACLARITASHTLTLFEYWLSDKAGHGRGGVDASRVVSDLDRFWSALLPLFEQSDMLLVICSDHGNLEDLSSRSHTRNPVPLAAIGPGAELFGEVKDLTGITPAILRALSGEEVP